MRTYTAAAFPGSTSGADSGHDISNDDDGSDGERLCAGCLRFLLPGPNSPTPRAARRPTKYPEEFSRKHLEVNTRVTNTEPPPVMQLVIVDPVLSGVAPLRWTPICPEEFQLLAVSSCWGYPFNRSYHMFSAWRILALASTTRARLASFKPGFEPMRTAWTTSNGCGGPTASSVRVAATKAVGAWAMAASCVRRVRHAVR